LSRKNAGEEGAEAHIFELSLFLITAARGCVDEPKMYGPLRLIEAISRLADVYGRSDKLKPDPFMAKVKAEIDANKYQVMASEETFVAFLDKMVVEFTDEMKRRYQRPARA
jgi:hypothetical protein